MSEQRPWFKFWHRDFWTAKEVRVMSAEGVALYLTLLTEQWETGAIEDSSDFWQKIHGYRFDQWDRAWAEVRPCFDECDGGMANRRLELEREHAVKGAAKRTERAKKAASVRWACSEHATSMPQACLADAKKEMEREREKENEKEKETKKEKRGRDARARKAFYERPPWEEIPSLDNDQIREAWAEFIGNKKRRAAGPLSEKAVRRHMETLDGLGPTLAVECLRYSADGNYPTIYPDRFEGRPTTTSNGQRLTPTQQIFEDTLKRYEREAAEQKAQKESQCLLPPNHEL